ncbi:hypothetical protein PH5382_03730 [Phaeobacter sp. CECT 5382]|nr:hypothetical protein PH5382_03730 [Phaeobacter sp. CECT 5382]
MRGTSFVVAPIACHAFFEKAEFKRLFRHHFLEILCLATQCFDLISVRSTCCVASKTALTGFHEVLGPFVVDALRYAFTTAQLSNAILAAQAIKDDPDLLFR